MGVAVPFRYPLVFSLAVVTLCFSLLVMGCDILVSQQDSSSSLPSASSIIREADRQGVDPYDLLARYRDAREDSLEERASRLRERAPENQKRKYDIELERDLSLLELEYQERTVQLDRRLSPS